MDNAIVQDKMILNELRGLVAEVIKETGTDVVRRKKMYVTEGPHENESGRNVITVQESFGEAFDVPYAPDLYSVQAGDSVWVEWVYGLGNACAVNSGAWQASDLPTCIIPTEDGLIIQVAYQPVLTVNQNGLVMTVDENPVFTIGSDGANMDVDTLAVSGHIQGDVVNTQRSASVTVNGKIQDVFDGMGKYLKGTVDINVPSGEYVEDVSVEGFHGPGKIYVHFAPDTVVKGNWTIHGNTHAELIGSAADGNKTTFVGSGIDPTMCVIDVAQTEYFGMSYINLHGAERTLTSEAGTTPVTYSGGNFYGVGLNYGTYACIHDCMIDRTEYGIFVIHSHLDIANCTGGAYAADRESAVPTVANMITGIMIDENGGYVNAKGTIPADMDSAGTGYESNGYPFTAVGTLTPTISDAYVPPVVDGQTVTWTASAGYYAVAALSGTEGYESSRGARGWKGGGTANLRMGYETSSMLHTAGIWIFSDAATIPTTLENKTITRATVSLTRTGSMGAASGAVVKPYYHNVTADQIADLTSNCHPWGQGETTETYTDCGCTAVYAGLGETVTFDLPQTMYSLLQDGTVKGFAIGMNHPTEYFQFTPTGCVLTVTYSG